MTIARSSQEAIRTATKVLEERETMEIRQSEPKGMILAMRTKNKVLKIMARAASKIDESETVVDATMPEGQTEDETMPTRMVLESKVLMVADSVIEMEEIETRNEMGINEERGRMLRCKESVLKCICEEGWVRSVATKFK